MILRKYKYSVFLSIHSQNPIMFIRPFARTIRWESKSVQRYIAQVNKKIVNGGSVRGFSEITSNTTKDPNPGTRMGRVDTSFDSSYWDSEKRNSTNFRYLAIGSALCLAGIWAYKKFVHSDYDLTTRSFIHNTGSDVSADGTYHPTSAR
jgi:hypothetical protein